MSANIAVIYDDADMLQGGVEYDSKPELTDLVDQLPEGWYVEERVNKSLRYIDEGKRKAKSWTECNICYDTISDIAMKRHMNMRHGVKVS
jgi:hypothetical protein